MGRAGRNPQCKLSPGTALEIVQVQAVAPLRHGNQADARARIWLRGTEPHNRAYMLLRMQEARLSRHTVHAAVMRWCTRGVFRAQRIHVDLIAITQHVQKLARIVDRNHRHFLVCLEERRKQVRQVWLRHVVQVTARTEPALLRLVHKLMHTLITPHTEYAPAVGAVNGTHDDAIGGGAHACLVKLDP